MYFHIQSYLYSTQNPTAAKTRKSSQPLLSTVQRVRNNSQQKAVKLRKVFKGNCKIFKKLMNGLCSQHCCHSYSIVVVTSLTDKRVTKQLCRVSPTLPLCSTQWTAYTNKSLVICPPWPIESSHPHAIPAPSAIPDTKPQPHSRATEGHLGLCLPTHHTTVQSTQAGASCWFVLPVTDSKTKEIQKKQFQAGQEKEKPHYQTKVRSREEEVGIAKLSKAVRVTMLRKGE